MSIYYPGTIFIPLLIPLEFIFTYFFLSLHSRMIFQLKRKKKLNTKNLKTLLVPVLEHLDLSSDVYVTQGILKAMWTNCPNLRVLNLKNCGYIITDNILETLFRVRTWSRFFISRYFFLLVLDGYTAWLFPLVSSPGWIVVHSEVKKMCFCCFFYSLTIFLVDRLGKIFQIYFFLWHNL